MKRTNVEAVIFDWAGTTVDYGCFAPVQAFIEAFEQFGITPSIEEVRKPMGMLKRDHVKTMLQMERIRREWKRLNGKDFTEQDVDTVYERSESAILDILKNYTTPKPHVLETVGWLRKKGIKIGSTTGYTDDMMEIVVSYAKKEGYEPDYWCSPNAVNDMGRPYPYMIFENMKALRIQDVHNVIKVGDTVSDIKEGVAAGVLTVGVIEGSSVMGLRKEEYDALNPTEKKTVCQQVQKVFQEAGADCVIQNMLQLMPLIESFSEL